MNPTVKRDVSILLPYFKKEPNLFVFMQKRTLTAPRFPGHYGFFGGGIEKGEEPEQALQREIKEEMDFIPEKAVFFGKFDFDYGILHAYLLEVSETFGQEVTIYEGESGKFFSKDEIDNEPKIIGQDRKVLEHFFKTV